MKTRMKLLGMLLGQLEEKTEDEKILGLITKGKDVLGQMKDNKNGLKTSIAEIKDEEDSDSVKTEDVEEEEEEGSCLLYTSPSPRDLSTSRMPSSA